MYNNYVSRLKNIVAQGKDHKFSMNSLDKSQLSVDRKKIIQEQRSFNNSSHLFLQPLNSFLKNADLQSARLGLHPDFQQLKGTDEFEYHYIVSVFVDIKGSTRLHNKYNIEDIFQITNTIQSAAIHTCIAFGGHIQRLQGDGVFAYFGGKYVTKEEAVRSAVIASSMFTYFVENDIKDLFEVDGIKEISTRIGVDFGDDDQVLWATFGMLDVCELTTLSLHTSLAAKMQAFAKKNGIIVGDHIKQRLGVDDKLYDYVRDAEGKVSKRYIFQNLAQNFYYTQHVFDWFNFLKTLPFIEVNAQGELFIISPEEKDRLKRLRDTSSLFEKDMAYITPTAQIVSDPKNVYVEKTRFHYGKQ